MFNVLNSACGVIDGAFRFGEFGIAAAVVVFAIVLAFLAYAASRSPDNPLRQVAGLLAMRVGLTAGIGMVDVPVTLVAPPLGGVMDVASFLGLAAYWIVGFWKAGRAFMPPKPGVTPAAPPAPPTIVYMHPPPQQGQVLMPVPPSYDRQPYQPAPPYPAE